MKKLDSKSLMLGDWVRLRYKKSDMAEVVKDFQVSELRRFYKECPYVEAWSKESGNMGDVERLEPIPLTPEILEKNGFKLIGERFVFGEIDDDLVELNLSINNSYRAKISVADLMISHTGWIKYIHELQHALRLCKIEKEITI